MRTHIPATLAPGQVRFWLIVTCLVVTTQAATNYDTPYYFSTLAGTSSIGSTDGPGSLARFYAPRGIAVDRTGNVYVADAVNDTIRKITPDGIVTTLAGTAGVFSAGMFFSHPMTPADIDGTGADAKFANPEGIAVDASGMLYVSDKMVSVIRKVTPAGAVTTWVGSPQVFDVADGTGTAARFNAPVGVALDAAGNLYVADWENHLIRKSTPAGVVTTLAGQAGVFGSADGTGTQAQFVSALYLAVDKAGNVYVPDYNLVRKITPDGVVTTIAGRTGSAVPLGYLQGIVVDQAGDLFVADAGNSTICKITPSGTVTIFAGSPGLPGSTDGTGSAARFRSPCGLAIDATDTIYVADQGDNTIRKITPDGVVTTLAGLGLDYAIGNNDGLIGSARFENATQVAAGPAGTVYVSDTLNHTIRQISSQGFVSTVAGSSTGSSDNNEDGVGSTARFAAPGPIAVDASGTIYVGELDNGTIRKITSNYVVSTLNPVGGGKSQFKGIGGITTDTTGDVYVSDNLQHTINRISATGEISVLAGTPGIVGAVDGSSMTAAFNQPEGLVIDPIGDIFVADTGNQTIRKITSSGAVTTVAGAAGFIGDTDGPASEARFSSPSGIALDPTGNLFVADSSNSIIRKITPDGIVSTVAGRPGTAGIADGTGQEVRFNKAEVIAVDNTGKLLVSNASTIQRGVLAGAPVISTQPAGQTITAGNSVQFFVGAGGTPSPTYQWYVNGGIFTGATSSTLSFANVISSDAGDYTVVVTNSLGSVTSAKATLTVTAAPAPTPTPTPAPSPTPSPTPAPTPAPAPSPTPAPSSNNGGGGNSSSGGGGAINPWFMLALFALGTKRMFVGRAVRSEPDPCN